MNTKYILFYLLSLVIGMTACLDDKGNYDYVPLRNVNIKLDNYAVNCFVRDTVEVHPKIDFLTDDSTDYSFEWQVDYEVVSTDSVLRFVPTVAKNYECRFAVKDMRTAKVYSTTMTIVAATIYQEGFAILYEENGVSKLGHINVPTRLLEQEYSAYYDLYKEANGEDMGSGPVKLVQHFFWNATNICDHSEVLVIQNGGQGPVELNGNTNEKEVLTADEFIGGTLPENCRPVSAFYPFYMNVVLDDNGNIYTRYIRTPQEMGYHASMYNNVPVYINGGYKIKDIIETEHQYIKHFLLYDELNGRLLQVYCGYYTTAEEYYDLNYAGVYPSGYIPVNDFGDYELVYGSAYGGVVQGSTKYVLILKNGEDWKIETFGVASNAKGTITLDALDECKDFSGKTNGYVTDESVYWMLKSRTYLFFSGGVDNSELYYYDLGTGESHHYASLGGRIVSIHPVVENNELGVGLENGTFVLFDVSETVLASGQSVELYRKDGFGRIVDVIYKYKMSGKDL